MADHATKARGGSVITSLVDLCRQNLDQGKIAEGWGFNSNLGSERPSGCHCAMRLPVSCDFI